MMIFQVLGIPIHRSKQVNMLDSHTRLAYSWFVASIIEQKVNNRQEHMRETKSESLHNPIHIVASHILV